MVNSTQLDLAGNTFGAVIIQVFSGTDEDQKAKVRRMLDCFTQISLGIKSKWKSDIPNNSDQLESIGNGFGAVVLEIFSGSDEDQRVKLRKMLDGYTQISLAGFKRKWIPDILTNINQAKNMRLSLIHNILPPEMMEKILKLLNFKDIYQVQLTCRRWNEIIVKGNLLKKASGKSHENDQNAFEVLDQDICMLISQ